MNLPHDFFLGFLGFFEPDLLLDLKYKTSSNYTDDRLCSRLFSFFNPMNKDVVFLVNKEDDSSSNVCRR